MWTQTSCMETSKHWSHYQYVSQPGEGTAKLTLSFTEPYSVKSQNFMASKEEWLQTMQGHHPDPRRNILLRISGATTVSLLSSVTSSCLLTLMTASSSLNMSFITSRTFPRKFSGWSHSPTTSDKLRFMVSHHRKINTHWAHAQPIPLNTVKQITNHGRTLRMLKTFDGVDPTERVGWTSPPLSNINM